MNRREETIRLWFDMWLQKSDSGILNIFSENAVYTESWGPEYHSAAKIKLWFDEWNTRGTVLQWDIKQYFHKENQDHCRVVFQKHNEQWKSGGV